MKIWEVIDRPLDVEADLKFGVDEAPIEVRERYDSLHTGELVAFATFKNEYGFIRLNRSVTFKYSVESKISLYEVKPAKGSGHVGLSIKSNDQDVSVVSSRHSKKSFEWLTEVQKILEKSFELEAIFEDYGFDA